jgi:hypothetical protein
MVAVAVAWVVLQEHKVLEAQEVVVLQEILQ